MGPPAHPTPHNTHKQLHTFPTFRYAVSLSSTLTFPHAVSLSSTLTFRYAVSLSSIPPRCIFIQCPISPSLLTRSKLDYPLPPVDFPTDHIYFYFGNTPRLGVPELKNGVYYFCRVKRFGSARGVCIATHFQNVRLTLNPALWEHPAHLRFYPVVCYITATNMECLLFLYGRLHPGHRIQHPTA